MRKYIIFTVIALIIAAVATAVNLGGLDYLGANDVQAQSGSEGGDAANSTDALPPVEASTDVIADAVVVPAQFAGLSMMSSGVVEEIMVEEGSAVEAGQIILRLRNAQDAAAVRQAEAQLFRAQARMEELRAGSRPQEIAQFEAALDAAKARLTRLTEGARTEEIAAAEADLAAAQAAYSQLFAGPANEAQIAAKADLANAEAARSVAQRAYNEVKWRNDVGMTPQAQQLMEATNNYEAAKARYDQLFASPDADAIAAASASIKQAQAALERLQTPVSAAEIAEAEAEVRRAQANLDLIQAGNRDETIAAAAADIVEAEANLDRARAALDDTELRAPFAGTLAALDVRVGEQVSAGMPVARLADLSTWQIETDDLTEIGVVNVEEGAQVTLTFDAIEDLELTGTVMRIKPIGENKQGDITYTAIIQPSQQDPRLRWNMTAVATIE